MSWKDAMHLPLSTLHAVYRVTHPFRVPYHAGSMLHGALGRALLAVTGSPSPTSATLNPSSLDTLPETHPAISRLFKPAPRPDLPTAVRFGAADSPPPPVAPLIPPAGGQRLEAGAEFAFGLRCFGELGAADVDILLRALEQFAECPLADEGGRVRLVSAGFVGARQRVLVVDETEGTEERLAVRFETPAWLVHEGRLALDLSFTQLFRAAWRRLAVLAALYGEEGGSDEETFRRLDALSREVTTVRRELRPLRWERSSDLKGQRHRMEGLVGTIEFAGPLGAFRSVMAAAEKVHLGKATSFGLGRVRAEYLA